MSDGTHCDFHEWERGAHMRAAFGVDGRKYACAICGLPRRPEDRPVRHTTGRIVSRRSADPILVQWDKFIDEVEVFMDRMDR